jgi:phosphatidylserine/phosphatidylglycerophosphate/cardiolipin synthase-like enzyme
VYVHAKVCVIDDTWAAVGSDNFNRRSWTHDSEASAAVCHPGCARDLQAWHARGRSGPRPPGRLRPLHEQPLSRLTRMWATPMYRTLYDPDGRPTLMKLGRRF